MLFFVAIIWVYNFIWFVPLDFIKFALQAVFHRSIHAVQPFERIHRRLLASRQAKGTVTPADMEKKAIEERRTQRKRTSRQEEALETKPISWIPKKFEQATIAGSGLYAPYTETLSALKKQNPLLQQF